MIGYGDPYIMERNAILEYHSNTHLESKGNKVEYAGYVQCFCEEREALGDLPDKLYGPLGDTHVCKEF